MTEATGALTLERLRDDIAHILHESPEDIGLDDNLMDLGLDSMRAMSLVTRWGSTGLTLDFSEFAARPTLSGWWEVIERRQRQQAGK